MNRDPQHAADRLERIQHLAHSALSEMRSLIHQLRPVYSDWPGLIPSLHQIVSDCEMNNGLYVDLSHDDLDGLSPDIEQALYRIIQEALNNIFKHAKTNQAWVSLRIDEVGAEKRIYLVVEDKGLGFTPANSYQISHLGLKSMQERTQILGGEFEIHSRPSAGTIIRVWIPIPMGTNKNG